MKRIICLLLCLVSLNVFAKNTITYVKMQRTACFGSCPSYTVEFFKTGQVVYNGKSNTKMKGIHRARMTKAQTLAFFRQFEKYNYAKVASKYTKEATDLPSMNISMIVNGKMKNVVNAESGPRFFKQIGADVDEKISELRWKGDVEEPETGDPMPVEAPDQTAIEVAPAPEVLLYVEQMPEFPGGDAALKSYLSRNIYYPAIAKENNIQGKVYCRFVVDKEGYVTNVNVVRGIGYGCDDEAVRVIKAMPRWKPGMQNGKAVNVSYTLPIVFKLL